MISRLKETLYFIRVEALSGVLLIIAAALAIYSKNSPFVHFYEGFLHAQFVLAPGLIISSHTLVNDLLMAIFFLVVGLEIKREFLVGNLSSRASAVLPIICALGGVVVPALFYLLFTYEDPSLARGWAIPTATDIAFSLGILLLFGKTLPFSLRIFLTALAIIDDLVAILVIVFFYTASLSVVHLLLGVSLFLVLITLNRTGQKSLFYYLLPGALLFYCIFQSGVHATVTGVLIALTIPLGKRTSTRTSPLKYLEQSLHPWVAYGVLPLFAFMNAGIDFSLVSLELLKTPLAIGCLGGLFIGKQLGVFLTGYIASKLGWVTLPPDTRWLQFYGVSILTGIGFTMSLFIGNLAFTHPTTIETMKVGVIAGSLLSMCLGIAVLYTARTKP